MGPRRVAKSACEVAGNFPLGRAGQTTIACSLFALMWVGHRKPQLALDQELVFPTPQKGLEIPLVLML